jgi:hypothetical protein
VSVLDGLGESPTSRSEPDVLIAWEDLLVVVEVKYRSPNDVKPGYANFSRYTGRGELFDVAPEEVARLGFYELVRNWRFGVELAERTGRRFVLVNLGPPALAAQTPALGTVFAQTAARRFTSVTWPKLLSVARERAAFPSWLETYVGDRGLDH